MKSYDETVNSVLDRIHKYNIEKKRRRKVITRTVASLSCVCLIALLGIGVWQSGLININPPTALNGENSSLQSTDKTDETTSDVPIKPGKTGDRYKDLNIFADEYAIVWSWECLTIYEKYTNLEIDGVEYFGKGRAVSAALVGESIGNYTVVGYDRTNDNKKYTAEFEVYKLQDIAQNQFVAVKMDGSYYVFKSKVYAPPSTLGELMETVNLPRVVELNRFSVNGDNSNRNYFILNSDDYIWEVLSNCKSAVFVEDQNWTKTIGDRDYLSFSITSDALGVYKVVMYVTEDGYLWTNAFGRQYLFNIGEDAAGKIIKYAKENSTEADFEPYENSVTGKIVEITEEYILLDDSILCKDPADAITYKILLNDLRISRYVERKIVKVGDTVQITYEGEIDEANGNTINSAISVSKAFISSGVVLIPE